MPPEITDLNKYNQSMKKSMIDKIFFMDKVDAKTFVDFGCADGSMIEILVKLFPEHNYIGYDVSEEMIERAKEKDLDAFFTSNLEDVHEKINDENIAVILSSMIHEVYSYGEKEIGTFWSQVYRLNPNFIVVRDMCVSRAASRPSDPLSAARIRQTFDPNKISQWESKWGSLEENWSLVHFLLTYHYKNWEREYLENYLPVNYEDLLSMFSERYEPIFVEHYTLPYIRQKVFNDFGVQLQDRTHVKLIMKRPTS